MNAISQSAGPRVSVIMIFLNAERFIAEAIDSVLAQTFVAWELVLVDDGSTDGSTNIARRYSERFPDRIRYIDHPEHANLGMSASRNAGVSVAGGEYIAFLDSDDVYLPERLRRHIEVLDACVGAVAVQGRLEYWRSWNSPHESGDDEVELPHVGDGPMLVAPPYLLLLLLESRGATVPGICSVTLRRSTYLELGGCDESFRGLFEDQVLWCKLYARHSVYVIPDILTRYRQHMESFTGRLGEQGLVMQRHHHLEWLARYVDGLDAMDPRVQPALHKALFEYRHPLLWSLSQAPTRGLRLLRWLGHALIPEPLAAPMRDRWKAVKRRKTKNRVDRARARLGEPHGR
jgi:glycosyltransferase involved in cell wall biosynthesis